MHNIQFRLLKHKLSLIKDNTENFILHKINTETLEAYIEYLSKHTPITLNKYLNIYFEVDSKQNLIADLSNRTYQKNDGVLNLKGADFSGVLFFNTYFNECDLTSAKFTHCDLDKVFFKHSKLDYVDFRDSNLRNCRLSEDYIYAPWNQTKGVKFSHTESVIKTLANIKDQAAKHNEQKRVIADYRLQLEDVMNKLSWLERLQIFLKLTENPEYQQALNNYHRAAQGQIHDECPINPSFAYLFNEQIKQNFVYDPVICKAKSQPVKKIYFNLTRKQLEEFIAANKVKKISLHKYVQKLYSQTNKVKADQEILVIADLSSSINKLNNNKWNHLDFSNLDFTGLDLSHTNFSGSNFSNSNFTKTNISHSNFAAAILTDSIFNATVADEVDFTKSDLSGVTFQDVACRNSKFDWSICKNSQFIHSKMAKCTFVKAQLQQVTFDKVNLLAADWQDAYGHEVSYLEVKGRHNIFNNSQFDKVNFKKSDFSESLFNNATVNQGLMEECLLKSIQARGVNFNHIIIKSGVFDHSDLNKARFSHSKIVDCNFVGGAADYIINYRVVLQDNNFSEGSFKFAKFKHTELLDNIIKQTDFTAAVFNHTIIKNISLYDSALIRVHIDNSTLHNLKFINTDWHDLVISNSILQEIDSQHTRINDGTLVRNSKLTKLQGEFYHYDENALMNTMSLEELKKHIRFVNKVDKLKNLGKWGELLGIFSRHYRLPADKIKILEQRRRRNKQELQEYLKQIVNSETAECSVQLFRLQNKYL